MTKRIVRLTESDLEKIVRRVIKESMGVGFMSGEPNGLKIKKMETKEQPLTGAVTPDQQREVFNQNMLTVNQKLPLDSKTLATMASKLNGIEKSLVGPQFETALKGIWGDDLMNSFNKSMATLGYQLGQAGPYKNMMSGRIFDNINSIDNNYQTMFRVLTERTYQSKPYGYYLDFNKRRAINFLYDYNNTYGTGKKESDFKTKTEYLHSLLIMTKTM